MPRVAGRHRNRFQTLFPTPQFLRMPAVGVDITDGSVKFMHLEPTAHGLTPKTWGRLSVPPGVVENGKIISAPELAKVLTEVRTRTKLRHVHASLPEEYGYLFQAEVPADSSPSELMTALEFNLRENVPLPPEEAIMSYAIIPNFASPSELPLLYQSTGMSVGRSRDASGKHTASVSVYPKDIVESYVAVFKEAGLAVASVELEAQAEARAVVPEGDSGTYLVIDVGTLKASLSIANRGVVVFTTTLEVGGDDLNSAIQKSFSVSFEEADRLKNERGFMRGNGKDDLFTPLMSTMSVFKEEIGRHYSFWDSERTEKPNLDPIDRVILSGGNANLKGFPEYLEAYLRVPVVRGNVWENAFSFDDYIPAISANHSLEYATAVGLALRSAVK